MFNLVTATLYLHIAPKFVNEPIRGVEDHLNRMLLKFNPLIGGVIMSYTNIQFTTDRAPILYDSPFMHFNITCNLIVFAPTVGAKFRGVINKQSPTHIGLLVFNLFNVSISNENIPSDDFIFVPDSNSLGEVSQTAHFKARSHSNKQVAVMGGNWLHSPTQTMLSVGSDLEFVVVEVLRSHDFISIRGSLNGVEFTPLPTHIPIVPQAKFGSLITFDNDDEDGSTLNSERVSETLSPAPEDHISNIASEHLSTPLEGKGMKRKRSDSQSVADGSSIPEPQVLSVENEIADSKKTKTSKKKSKSKKSKQTKSEDSEKASKKRKKDTD